MSEIELTPSRPQPHSDRKRNLAPVQPRSANPLQSSQDTRPCRLDSCGSGAGSDCGQVEREPDAGEVGKRAGQVVVFF